jgi:hypothetical protein
LSEIDRKLDEILEKLAVSKVDNSFLLGFSFLSILFGLSNLILNEQFHKKVLMIGAVIYFVVSFYIGYLRGAMRDNWGFRILGWIWMSLSAAVITASLVILLMLEADLTVSPLFPYGLFLLFASIAYYLLLRFVKDMCRVMPNLRCHISSISPVLKRYISPLINPITNPRFSKLTYVALSVFLIAGAILTALGILPIHPI